MICSYILNGTGQQPTTMLRTKEILEQEHFIILELFIYFKFQNNVQKSNLFVYSKFVYMSCIERMFFSILYNLMLLICV